MKELPAVGGAGQCGDYGDSSERMAIMPQTMRDLISLRIGTDALATALAMTGILRDAGELSVLFDLD